MKFQFKRKSFKQIFYIFNTPYNLLNKLMIMKQLVFFLLVLLTMSCGSAKYSQDTSETAKKGNVLPPNTASNKYSEMRQGH